MAAAPELKHIYPAAGQQGTNVAVSIGKTDIWPKIWADTSGLRFSPTPMLGTYNVEISPDAPVGPHLVRAWNEEGASTPRFFIVSRDPEVASIEPNDNPASPQVIGSLPATIGGRLDKNGDVDCYSVKLNKGQTLVSWIEAYVLASAFDGLLRITDAAGRVIAFNHDYRTLDPLLAWTAPEDGTFIVQVMGFAYPATSAVQLTGGEPCVYRLHLTRGPTVRFTMPAMVPAGTKTLLRLIGWNLPTASIEWDTIGCTDECAPLVCEASGIAFLQPPTISAINEKVEPDTAAPEIEQPLEVPSAITGRIRKAGEEARYTFVVSKGRAYEIKLTAAAIGSPLDAWVRVENTEGKEMARNDDARGRDPQLKWTAPVDGTFTIVVGNVVHRGGDDYLYRLAITDAAPTVAATIASHSANITAGKTADLKVSIKRSNGFKAPLNLVAKELPSGISAPPVEVPEKDGELTFQLTAEATANPAGKEFSLVLRERDGTAEHPVRYSLAATSEDNGVPQGFSELVINSTDRLWLTVLAAAASQ